MEMDLYKAFRNLVSYRNYSFLSQISNYMEKNLKYTTNWYTNNVASSLPILFSIYFYHRTTKAERKKCYSQNDPLTDNLIISGFSS